MGFRDNVCEWGHTSICPGKNEARSWWAHKLHEDKRKHQGVITVSHGALDTLSILRHPGFIQVVDQDKGSCTTAEHCKRKYAWLDIRSPMHMTLHQAVIQYFLANELQEVGVIDADFTCKVGSAPEIISETLFLLDYVKWSGKFLLTFVNHRDDFGRNGTKSRLAYLRKHLPGRMRISGTHQYSSDWFGRWGEYHKGSAMCVVEIQRG